MVNTYKLITYPPNIGHVRIITAGACVSAILPQVSLISLMFWQLHTCSCYHYVNLRLPTIYVGIYCLEERWLDFQSLSHRPSFVAVKSRLRVRHCIIIIIIIMIIITY